MALATSQIQKHFQMHSIYRRSKDVCDVERMYSDDKMNEIDRRKPTKSVQTLDTRVDTSSFMNSVQIANNKLDKEISRFKKRYQNEDEELNEIMGLLFEEEDVKQYWKEEKKIRGLDWSKAIGRKEKSQNKPLYRNQDRFNNFEYGIKPSRNKSIDMKRSIKKSIFNKSYDNQEDIDSISIGVKNQKSKFDSSTFKCLFAYDKQDLYSKSLPPLPLAPLDSARLEKAQKLVSVNKNNHKHSFYDETGKEFPAQMHMKQSKNNEFYFQPLSERKKEDIGGQMRKQRMLKRRLEQIRLKKEGSPDVRYELCDEKFFKRRELKKQKQ